MITDAANGRYRRALPPIRAHWFMPANRYFLAMTASRRAAEAAAQRYGPILGRLIMKAWLLLCQ